MMYGSHMSTGGWVLSIGATVIILALVVAAIVWLASVHRSETGQDASPGEILDQRLAAGEITVEAGAVVPRVVLEPNPIPAGKPGIGS
jgi:uncharacterized membrane protein